MKKITKLWFTLSSLMAVLVLAGCGQNEVERPSGAPKQAASAQGAQVAGNLVAERSVTVTANDQMKFNLERLEAKAGEVLSLTLDNVGTMPKFSMGHNLVILERGTDVNAFVEAAMSHPANDYLPTDQADLIVAATALLGGGESDTIVFQVPSQAGEYPFVCSFPGHLQVGMGGVLVVR